MKINQISQLYGTEIQKASGNQKQVEKTDKPKKADSVNVSKAGQSLATQASSEAATRRIESLPEVRTEKVQEVIKKMQDGFYDTKEFRSELADKLIKNFDLSSGS